MSEWGGTLFCAAGELSLVESKGVFCERITLDSASATKYSRAKGSYITLRCENFAALLSRQNTLARAIAAELVRFLPKSGRVLVAGLGNRALIADAVGPLTIAELPPLPRIMLAETGVPKKTGIKSGELLHALCARFCPAALIAVDSLTAREQSRLCAAFQISDAGLRPGSAAGGECELSQKTLGLPVISLGFSSVIECGGALLAPAAADPHIRAAAKVLARAITAALS